MENNEKKTATKGLTQGPTIPHIIASGTATVTAVSSVDMLAPLVVEDRGTATAIKSAVCKLDDHDLTALRDNVIPGHVNIPDNENSKALARSYAGAELSDRDKKSSWWKSWIGWAMALLGIALGVVLGAWLA